MRPDITLYVLAIVFFMIALLTIVLFEGTNQTLWLITSSLLGILSLSLGFVQKPKAMEIVGPPQTAATETSAPPSTPSPQPIKTLQPPPLAPEILVPTGVAQPIESPSQPTPQTTATITVIPQQEENVLPQAPQKEQKVPTEAPQALETSAVPEEVVAVKQPKVHEGAMAAQEVAVVLFESPLMQVRGIGKKELCN